MSSSVHFRFKSAREFETLSFEGDFLKVADLKVAIVARKKLNFGEGFDLEISDASTGDVFSDESALVQKNTSVIVRRVPGLKQGGILSRQEMAAKNERYAEKQGTKPQQRTGTTSDQNPVLPKTIEGSDEAERIASLVMQSNVQYDQFPPPVRGRYANRSNVRGRGSYGAMRNAQGQSSFPSAGPSSSAYPDRAPRPSSNYVCHRCNRPGHWIDQCPTNGDPTYDRIKVRAPTGIPRSMLRQVDAPESGTGLQDSSGHFVTLQPNEEEFARQTVGLRLSQAAASGADRDAGSEARMQDGDKIKRDDQNGASGQQSTSHDDVNANTKAQPTSGPQEVGRKMPQVTKETEMDRTTDEAKVSSKKDNTGRELLHESGSEPPSRDSTGKPSEQGRIIHHGKKPVSSRIRQAQQPPRVGVPPVPMPAIPHGFPPLGMPPIPPGMPPIPPHILMAMAMTNRQNGGHPQFPPGMHPNIPMPFSTSVPSKLDKQNQDVVTETQKVSSEPQQLTCDAASPENTVGKKMKGDRQISPEAQRDWNRDETGDREEERPDQRSVDHPASEMIDSAFNSKPDSHPSRALRVDRGDTRVLKQHSFYENENGLHSESRAYDRKEANYRSRSPSSSCVGSPPDKFRGSPRRRERRGRSEEVFRSLSPRRTASEKARDDRSTPIGRREERNTRYRSIGRSGDSPKNETADDARHGLYSRRRSPSPVVRGRHGMNGTGSSDHPVGRSRSPEKRSRYGSPGHRFRGKSSRGWRGRDSPDRRIRRDGSTERRFRSSTPPRSSRYDSRGRDDFKLRRQRLSEAKRSPSLGRGRDPSLERGSDENRRRYEPADRTLPTIPGSEQDERDARKAPDGVEQHAAERRKGSEEIFERSSEDIRDEKRLRQQIPRSSRRKRKFDGRPASEPSDLRRPRRQRTEGRQSLYYEGARDRPSVHERLGRPVESRKRKRPRRSVHDRLG